MNGSIRWSEIRSVVGRVQAASRCYQCASGQGWTDCAAKQAFTSCPDDSDNCGQYIVTITNPNTLQYSTSYGKGCFSSISCQNPQTSQECNAFRAKHANFLVNCQGSCCATNDCNGPVLPAGNLKCYACMSTKSWDDCASVQKEVTCALGNDRCGSASKEEKSSSSSVAAYAKGCLAQSHCSGLTHCCSGNLCNSGNPGSTSATGPVVSVTMFLACAIVAFVR
ncbi:hypothetical protein OS493_003303 [Desmophyllum pertusum]|uniref:UPAR/Ly6 domain-containing protein n=1 Tax=Desmophyllum pertusum TaxID=174260 RepID=A0A9X0A5A5_9CNID|nr:hypothetical protein OS493_003303 [Desmophyllum pertusum]